MTLAMRTILPVITSALFTSFSCPAQGVYNASDLFVGDVALYVEGEIRNTGRVENGGHISLTGDWESQGLYGGEGIVELNGQAPQRIAHYGQDWATLIINGPGTKYIKGQLDITAQLILKEGIVEVSPADVFKVSFDASISGGSGEAYVDGAITTEGTGYKFFPIGKNGTYAPIELLDIKGAPAEFSIEVFEDAPVISVEDAIVRRSLYWQRKEIRGRFGGSPVAVDYDANFFSDEEDILLITGTEWDEPFTALKNVEHSAETDKVISGEVVYEPLILLGEVSESWRSADFYFSTALSPNASRVENRSVRVFGDRLEADQFYLKVYNRWGDLIFETNSLETMRSHGWDGRAMSGAALPTGTYPFRMGGRDKTGGRFEKTGVITIVY